MAQVTQFFQPPLYWQQFEDLTEGVFRVVFGDPNPQKVGRPGQAQNGVDVIGDSPMLGRVAVQCKRSDDRDKNNDPLPGGPVTIPILRRQIKEALTYPARLDWFYLATTAKRDAKLQTAAQEISDHNRSKRQFGVKVWFWDDYVAFLNTHDDLQRRYYRDVIRLLSSQDQDLMILETIALAFHRPAFEDRLHCEHFDDFQRAIEDTQRALRTGELVDRQNRHVIRKSVGGWRQLSDCSLRANLSEVDVALKEFRQSFRQGVKDGHIIKHNTFVEIRDTALLYRLERERDRCVRALNVALNSANLPTV